MNEFIQYLPTIITVISVVVSLTWFFAKMDKRMCLAELSTSNKLDDLKKDTEEIKEHAKYTNGKVAEVLNWKLQNQEFVEKMRSREVDIINILNK